MEKLVYLLWREASESAAVFGRRLVESAGPKLVQSGALRVAVNSDDTEVDLSWSVPVRDEAPAFAGLCSFWLPCVDDRPAFESVLRDACAKSAGYLVTESVPRDFDRRTWRDGTRTPGIKLVSVFEQPSRLTRDEFIARWHGSHTPLSLEIHPLWRYVRNVVARPLTPGAAPLAGIVEEQVREARELTDPNLFYGGKENLPRNMKRVLDDVRSFLDLERVVNVVMGETILSSE